MEGVEDGYWRLRGKKEKSPVFSQHWEIKQNSNFTRNKMKRENSNLSGTKVRIFLERERKKYYAIKKKKKNFSR